MFYLGDPSHRSVGLKWARRAGGSVPWRYRDVIRCHDATAVGHRLPTTLAVSSSHPRLPSTAPSRSFSNQLSQQRRSTQDPPPPSDEAWVLRVTLPTLLPRIGVGGSLPDVLNARLLRWLPAPEAPHEGSVVKSRTPIPRQLRSDRSTADPPPPAGKEYSGVTPFFWWRLWGLPAFP